MAHELGNTRSALSTLRGLRAGLGAEDIAVQGDWPLSVIQRHIGRLRLSGALPSIVNEARALSASQRRNREP